MFEAEFLTNDPESRRGYQEAIGHAASALTRALPDGPYSGRSPGDLAALFDGSLCPREGLPLADVLEDVETIIRNSINVSHPHTSAHLHCPPLIPALAAEVVLSALNQSMDSFDQAPAATVIEQTVVEWLCRRCGLPASAVGTFTAGGTQSNFTGLLLARDAFLQSRFHWSARRQGLPPEARRLRILCSEVAHFTVEKSAAQLGLGTDAVVRVAVDEQFRMSPRALERALDELRTQGLETMAVVATAGTTDFGSIDPLPEIAALVQSWGIWLHVDAAYGGALLLSDRHRSKLRGLEEADSVSIDFHKLFWQPVSCGAFLVRDAAHFELIRLHADYLNPESHEEQGIPDLVTRSLLTTRRFDALKLWVTLRALGRDRLGAMIDRTLALAEQAAGLIERNSRLELLHHPSLGCVLLRYRPVDPAVDTDAVNVAIRDDLFRSGRAVIGQTRVRGRVWLKLTLLNPCARVTHFADLLDQITACGSDLAGHLLQPERVSV